MAHDNDNNPARLISLNDACRLTSMSRTMVNRYRSEGRFPVAVELGERRIAFVRNEVLAWLEAKISARAAACTLASSKFRRTFPQVQRDFMQRSSLPEKLHHPLRFLCANADPSAGRFNAMVAGFRDPNLPIILHFHDHFLLAEERTGIENVREE